MPETPMNSNKFDIVGIKGSDAEKIAKPSLSYWKDALIRFRKNKLAVTGVILLFLMIFMAIFGQYISGHSTEHTNLLNTNKPPSAEHWFGTDDLGRDMFARTWEGARISIFIGLAAAFIDLIIGVLWGGIAGLKGGKTDEILMRIADILYGIPYLLVVILIIVLFEKVTLLSMILAMTLIGWVGMAKIVRGQVLQLKTQEYVLAARTLGAKTSRIMFKHLIPNTMSPILVTLTLTIPTAIFTEAFLSFLGLGISPPLASWGTMASEGLSAMQYYPWRLFFPATFICITMLCFNVIGDGLRDALDPKLRK